VFQMLDSIRDCFVTGKWEDDQDAATLLKEDGKEFLLIVQYCWDCFHDFLLVLSFLKSVL
jgi:ribosome biogenesis protein BMS1